MRERWEDVRVTIVRPGAIDQSGPCANTIPQDDLKSLSLPPGNSLRNTLIMGNDIYICVSVYV